MSFTFVIPNQAGASLQADGSGNVFIRVSNDDGANSGFIATIIDNGSGGAGTPQDLAQEGSSLFWSGNVPVPGTIPGTASATPNKTVRVQAVQGGSGASIEDLACFVTSSSQQAIAPLARFGGLLVPVTLLLQLDSPVRPGTCSHCDMLNRPTPLIHGPDPGLIGNWFSPPIEFCADGAAPAWWRLVRTEPKTWTLTLHHLEKIVVTYRLSIAPAQAAAFPLHLQIDGTGGRQCRNWPRTVTIDLG